MCSVCICVCVREVQMGRKETKEIGVHVMVHGGGAGHKGGRGDDGYVLR